MDTPVVANTNTSSAPATSVPPPPAPAPVTIDPSLFSVRYAGFGERLGALIIDIVLIAVIVLPLNLIVSMATSLPAFFATSNKFNTYTTKMEDSIIAQISSTPGRNDNQMILPSPNIFRENQAAELAPSIITSVFIILVSIIIMFIPLVYQTVCTAIWGQTLGKKLVKIKVVRSDNSPKVGFIKAFIREVVGKFLSSFFLLGYLWVIWDKKKQAWHDKLAGTVVVKV